jgi:hypothetical protein
MVLKNNLTYEPPMKKIKEEGDIIILLDDVAANLHSVGYPTPTVSLKEFLTIIEKGEYEVQGTNSLTYNHVDLSKAQNLIRNYRYNSERGCQSCDHEKSYMPLPDEHVTFCSLYEEHDVVDSGSSPRVKQFREVGCSDKKAIFPKTIEQILTNFK